MAVSAILFVACLGILGPPALRQAYELAQDARTYLVLVILASCVLGGIYGSLTRRLPQYAGDPPLSSLMQHLQGPALTTVLALALLAGAWHLAETATETGDFATWAWRAALGLTLYLALASIALAVSLIRQYRALYAWLEIIPAHQRNC
jgi:drug/metabolite transporter (DMT)-like permease